jgi:hypothetical protein
MLGRVQQPNRWRSASSACGRSSAGSVAGVLGSSQASLRSGACLDGMRIPDRIACAARRARVRAIEWMCTAYERYEVPLFTR